MLLHELEKLIKSLSPAEKKHFQVHSAALDREKDYVRLYELIMEHTLDMKATWEQRFSERYPAKSLENTANYLYKVLTDNLIQVRIEQDSWYQQYQCLLKARLCFERSVPARAFKELQKAAKLATDTQNHTMGYQAARMELTALADSGFPGLTEQELVDKQMKAKHTLQTLRQIHEHYSLYELLSFRLTQGKLTQSAKQDRQVNDLILSELSLSTRGSQHQFEPQKLHLLFQSFFFIHTGEYRSALRIFYQLTQLIEANESMWDYPPYDYLSALDGILDSLRSIGYYGEMNTFINKLEALSDRPYPEHFRNLAALTVRVYRLNRLSGQKQTEKATDLIVSAMDNAPYDTLMEGHEKQLELYYFQSLVHFQLHEWAKAKRKLNQLFAAGKQNSQSAVYRAGRLLHILLSYELDDLEYLDYEIRSYKRVFAKYGKAFRIEKLLFNTIAADPKRRGNAWKANTCKKIADKLREVKSDKRELLLLKYFDFGEWLLAKHS